MPEEEVVETMADADTGENEEAVDGHAPGGPFPEGGAKEADPTGLPVEQAIEKDDKDEKKPEAREKDKPADDKDSGEDWSDVLARASDMGFEDEKALRAEFASADEARKALRVLDRSMLRSKPKSEPVQQPGKQGKADEKIPASETPAFKARFEAQIKALEENGFDKQLVEGFKLMLQQHEADQAALATLRDANAKASDGLKQAEFDRWVRKFDREVEHLGSEYEGILGKGATDELDGDSAKKRWELFEAATAYGHSMEQIGKKLSFKECVARTAATMFEGARKAKLEAELIQKAEGQKRKLQARPTNRETRNELKGEAGALKKVREKLRSFGT